MQKTFCIFFSHLFSTFSLIPVITTKRTISHKTLYNMVPGMSALGCLIGSPTQIAKVRLQNHHSSSMYFCRFHQEQHRNLFSLHKLNHLKLLSHIRLSCHFQVHRNQPYFSPYSIWSWKFTFAMEEKAWSWHDFRLSHQLLINCHE